MVVEKRDGPQTPVLVVDVIIPYSTLFKPLSVPLDVRWHVVFGTERNMEPLGWVVPSYVDYFWCVDLRWHVL